MIPADLITAAFCLLWIISVIFIWMIPDWEETEHHPDRRAWWVIFCLVASVSVTGALALLANVLIKITRP